jgi:hypothetical protein
MMKLAIVFMAILCVGAWAEEENVIKPSSEIQFSPERLDSGLRWLAAYGRFPKTSTKLDISALREKIGEWFPNEWRRFIKPNLIPSKKFISENVTLLAADEFVATVEPYIVKEYPQFPHFNEDILFLRYRVADRDYMIVESGGKAGRFILFVRVAAASVPDEVVNVSDVARKGLVMRGVAWLGMDSGGCLLINKDINASNHRAWEPQPNEWFKMLMENISAHSTNTEPNVEQKNEGINAGEPSPDKLKDTSKTDSGKKSQ